MCGMESAVSGFGVLWFGSSYDPPKWKTLDMIEPGLESVFEFVDMVESRNELCIGFCIEFCIELCIESRTDSLMESLIESRIESRAGTTVRPELVVRILHRRFCAAAFIPACCISGPMGGSGAREVV